MTGHAREPGNAGDRGPANWVFWAFAVIAGYFVLAEHRAHFIEFLPYLLLLACPLLHLFGHRHHGAHGGEAAGEDAAHGSGADGGSHPSTR